MTVSWKRRILLTGSEGIVGKILVSRLQEFELIKLDRFDIKRRDYIKCDLADADSSLTDQLKNYQPFDCLIHLAADSNVKASWESILKNNIIATRNIFEFSRENTIKKVIFASSNHVTGFYEKKMPDLLINSSVPTRPDSYYGLSKAFGELMARYFSDKFDMNVICLRLGTILENDDPSVDSRFRATWLSHYDLAQLVKRCIESTIKFGIYYACSNNTQKIWDISDMQRELFYFPRDNAESFFAQAANTANTQET